MGFGSADNVDKRARSYRAPVDGHR